MISRSDQFEESCSDPAGSSCVAIIFDPEQLLLKTFFDSNTFHRARSARFSIVVKEWLLCSVLVLRECSVGVLR